MTLRILYVVGARPNLVKMAPVLAELRRRHPGGRHILVHTGQHYDRMMSDVLMEELVVPEPSYHLGVGSGSHAAQTARAMERLEPILQREQPHLIIVPGDVNSTLAAALTAAKLQIPVAHVEAGLRSFDRAMPEEVNRVLTDQISSHLFIHSEEALNNLHREGIPDERIFFVGNTMIDSLTSFESRLRDVATIERHGVTPGNYLLVTLHRPALVDGPLLDDVMGELTSLAAELPVIFPVHPRTRHRLPVEGLCRDLRLIDPVGYVEFLTLEAHAAGVLTDSGGVQEETTYLKVPCFTLRDSTERPITVSCGTNTLLGLNPARIAEILPSIEGLRNEGRSVPCPMLWDGHAAERIGDVLLSEEGIEALEDMRSATPFQGMAA